MTGLWYREPETIMKRPFGSDMMFVALKSVFLWIMIALPRDLELKFELKIWSAHDFLSLL